jgi:hypothetical protein
MAVAFHNMSVQMSRWCRSSKGSSILACFCSNSVPERFLIIRSIKSIVSSPYGKLAQYFTLYPKVTDGMSTCVSPEANAAHIKQMTTATADDTMSELAIVFLLFSFLT